MKILFVMNGEFHFLGPSNHLYEALISRLSSDGWEVHTIEKQSMQANGFCARAPEAYPIMRHICRMRPADKGTLIRRYLFDVIYVFLCMKHYLQNRDTDAVFLQSCNTSFFQLFLIKQLIRKPVVYNVQDIFPVNAAMAGMLRENSAAYKALRFLQGKAYQMADRIITISEDMKITLMGEGVPGKDIQVIHNWSDTDDIVEITNENNRFMKEKGIDENQYKVVYAGNVGAVQNVRVILNAARILKEIETIHFFIIGDGVRKDDLTRYAEKNGLKNVSFYPMQPPEYAPHIYSMADINVIPLAKGIVKTALPSKTAFCLSCGKPIIACVDTSSIFAGMLKACDRCYVVDSDDAEGLAACILRNMENGPGYSSRERDLFRNCFSKEANLSGYISTIKSLIRANGSTIKP